MLLAEGVVVAVAFAGAADPTVLGGVGVLVAAEAVAGHEDCLALTELAAAPMRAATRVCGHAGPPARSPEQGQSDADRIGTCKHRRRVAYRLVSALIAASKRR